MNYEEAIERAKRGDGMGFLLDHWKQTQLALAHDSIGNVLDFLPADADREMVARLEDAKDTLRSVLGRMVVSG